MVRHPVSGRFTSEIAQGQPVSDTPPAGDPHDPGRIDQHIWRQPVSRPAGGLVPDAVETLHLTPADSAVQHGSSLAPHCPKTVTVSYYNLAADAQPDIAAVFGGSLPSGRAGQPAEGCAPINGGQPVLPRPPGVAYQGPPGSAA